MSEFWSGKRVLVTGHTGFKGGWLSAWLNALEASVFGFALPADTTPALFAQLNVADFADHATGDVRDASAFAARINEVQPDVVFHLAAQPLVRRSYREPSLTWDTNVMGVVNVLNGLRSTTKTCACVIVTTDKVYQNDETGVPLAERDPLGGKDPYSASKAAAELAVSSFRHAFFPHGSPVRLASSRAGNVIGGGDWAEDRIVPDIVRALTAGDEIQLRNPAAVRPWQHVLEPLSGYLRLAERMFTSDNPALQSAFNFGPPATEMHSVRELVDMSLTAWPGGWRDAWDETALPEAQTLRLSIDKAASVLNWHPRWSFGEAVRRTLDWYRAVAAGTGDVSHHGPNPGLWRTMIYTPLPLMGSHRVDLQPSQDERGFFARLYCEAEFAAHGLNTHWTQINVSMTRDVGALRGLHFQRPPKAEIKMVRCLRGAIFDVIVDLRFGAETFGQWAGVELTEDNRSMLYIPAGFAHGFQTLRPNTELLYFHSEEYSAQHEDGLRFDDPTVAITWPLEPSHISVRDVGLSTLSQLAPVVL